MLDLCKSMIVAFGLLIAVAIALLLTGCASAEPVPAPKPGFPDDMQLLCFQGKWAIGSPSAGEIVPLPIRCTET